MTSDANNLPPDRRGPRRFRRRSEPARPRDDASPSPADAAGETGAWEQSDDIEDVEQETLDDVEEAALDYETAPEEADLGPFDDEPPAAPELPAFDRVPREPPRVAEFGPLTEAALRAPIDAAQAEPPPPARDRDALARGRDARARDAYTYEGEGPGTDIQAGDLMRNPYVLAGLAVAAAIVLAVLVVILSGGGGGGGGGDDNGVIIDPLTPGAGRGVAGKSIATSTVREGPNADYAELGTLRSGQDVEVIGRNADRSWYQIYYPPKSLLPGWVPASALKLSNENANLPIASVTPISRPTVVQPTLPPEATETASPSPTATVPTSPPDIELAIVSGSCKVGQEIAVLVGNKGQGAITNRQIVLTVSGGGTTGTSTETITLQPGQSASLSTNTEIKNSTAVTVSAALLGDPKETVTANNVKVCNPTGAGGNP
ncbi:MAG TPA: SH3 domain-containing protein, partial [Dehalococcoidia bacterium]|nr:SH3 domain-containing protein [Dehalococcoidia bacterium]